MDAPQREISCLGLVLRAQAFSDRDLIFSLITQNAGKISAIAKSAKASSKFSSGIPDILDLGSFDLKIGRGGLYQVAHFKPQQAFKKIRMSLHTYVAACLWIESLDHLTSEAHHESHELFEIALATLKLIDESGNARNTFKILCEGLDNALTKTGFGSEQIQMPAGLKKLNFQARRIEEISGRQLKSWTAVMEVINSIPSSTPNTGNP